MSNRSLEALIDAREEEIRYGHTPDCVATAGCQEPALAWVARCDSHGDNSCRCTCGHWERVSAICSEIANHRGRR